MPPKRAYVRIPRGSEGGSGSGTHTSGRVTEMSDSDEELSSVPSNMDEEMAELVPTATTTPAAPTMADVMTIIRQQQETAERQNDLIMTLLENSNRGTVLEPTETGQRKYKMLDPTKYCGGTDELNSFLAELRDNFRSHEKHFPDGDVDKVAYALRFLGTWAEHTDSDQRTTKMTDPVTWGRELREFNHTCLRNYEQFENEIRGLYGDRNRKLNAIIKYVGEQLQNPDETARIYANRLRSLWRTAGWTDELSMYDLLWAGLRPGIRSRLGPTLPRIGRFDSIDELVERAAWSEIIPNKKNGTTANQSTENTKRKAGKKSKYEGGNTNAEN